MAWSVFLIWAIWALLLVRFPVFEDGVVRAVVRVIIWIIPACVFVLKVKRESLSAGFALKERKRLGLTLGLLGFIVIVALSALRYPHVFGRMKFRFDKGSWLNAVSTAPIAEEMVFRGVVLRVLLRRFSPLISLLISSALFALTHLPFWWIANGGLSENVVVAEGNVLVLGCWFGFLYLASRSLWAPLLCHVLNNVFSIAAGL